MLRLGEALLAAAPLLAGALLYGIVYHRLPSRRAVLALAAATAVLGAVLIWQSETDSLRPHEHYVPARLQNGALVEGHGG